MLNVGMVGVGCISGIYLENFANTFHNVKLIAVCDLIRERAEKAQKKYNVPKLYDTMEQLFADPEIDIVLNLTRPYQHFEVSKAALLAGKHVYSEKPLGADWEEGTELVRLAEEKGLYRRYSEEQTERMFTLEEIKTSLNRAGLTLVSVSSDFNGAAVTDTTERYYFTACRKTAGSLKN